MIFLWSLVTYNFADAKFPRPRLAVRGRQTTRSGLAKAPRAFSPLRREAGKERRGNVLVDPPF